LDVAGAWRKVSGELDRQCVRARLRRTLDEVAPTIPSSTCSIGRWAIPVPTITAPIAKATTSIPTVSRHCVRKSANSSGIFNSPRAILTIGTPIEPLLLVDEPFQGARHKSLVQANRNGFFYAFDRSTGELLLAKPFVKQRPRRSRCAGYPNPIPSGPILKPRRQ